MYVSKEIVLYYLLCFRFFILRQAQDEENFNFTLTLSLTKGEEQCAVKAYSALT